MNRKFFGWLGLIFVVAGAVTLFLLVGNMFPASVHDTVPTEHIEFPNVAEQTKDTPIPPAAEEIKPASGLLYKNPDNPRYFTDGVLVNGKYRVVFLSGSHFWDNLQDSGSGSQLPYAFNYSGWLDFLQARNHNFFRLWTWEQAQWVVESSTPYFWTPLPYQRTGPGNALDNQPKFDLTKFDQAYFDLMRARIMQASDRGTYVSIMLFDGWSVSYPKSNYRAANPWSGHPFNLSNNINGINGDPNNNQSGDEIQQLSIPAVTALQEAYVKKVIDTVNDLDNVLYEIANESNGGTAEVSWQYHMIDLIHSYEAGKPKQHPVGMTALYPNGDNQELFSSPADWISPNGDLTNPPLADGSKVIVADTDHLCGICGNRAWAWKSFTRGDNLLFMDQYDDSYKLEGGGYDQNTDENLRYNLGYIRTFANRINLVAMAPSSDTSQCSTGYCLRNAVANGAEYLVFLPTGETVANILSHLNINRQIDISLPSDSKVHVDLTDSPVELSVEWFNPENGTITDAGTVQGGSSQSFTAPFAGDAILYIYQANP